MKLLPLIAALWAAPMAMAQPVEVSPLQDIRAFQAISPSLVTSGLPAPADFPALKAAGVDVVINLMPDGNNKDYDNEAELVTGNGMTYVAIPVDWQNPKVEDVEAFFNMMETYKGQEVLVHCLANYRASAFVYLHQWVKQADGREPDMAKVMAPWGELENSLQRYPQWAGLIDDVKAQYAGSVGSR
ncbi:protein tyrosine phosphatase family protein [Marinobacter hydrocarbonoclasticus]|nr:protein tyrosine phosphatase family protein [Marinobacter nauticus]